MTRTLRRSPSRSRRRSSGRPFRKGERVRIRESEDLYKFARGSKGTISHVGPKTFRLEGVDRPTTTGSYVWVRVDGKSGAEYNFLPRHLEHAEG